MIAMHAENEADRRIVASLAQRIEGVFDLSKVANAIASMFEDAQASLVPILGPKGVAALYRRSYFLCTAKHPQFATTYESLGVAMNLVELRGLLANQTKEDAVFFGEEYLKSFYELLATLIGRSLAARLLLDVWANSLSGANPQEISR